MIEQYSKNIDMQDVGLLWQLTIKTIDDLRIIGNENLTLEMYIMQLVHLKSIDEKNITYEKSDTIKNENLIEKKLEKSSQEQILPNQIKSQLKNTDQIKSNPIKNFDKEKSKIEIVSFQDLINLANSEKEIELKYDLERNVKLVSFNKGKIDISFNEKLNKNFIKNLNEKLLKWTGQRWVISLSKNHDAKSIYEKNLEKQDNKFRQFEESKVGQEIRAAFPDAEITNIEEE